MTRNNPNYDRIRAMDKHRDNVVRETAGKTKLSCGHFVTGQPIATTFGRKLYVCPEGCGLKVKKR